MLNNKLLNLKKNHIKLGIYFLEYINQISSIWDNVMVALTAKNEIIIDSYYLQVESFIFTALKHTNLRFNKVSDIVIYDRPEYKYRFLVNYVINNVERDLKLRFRFSITSKYHTIPSITTLFQSSI